MSLWAALLLSCLPATAQIPQITHGGVVSAASYSSPIAPGEIVAIFGTNLFNGVAGSTSVTVSGVAAPVMAASPNQLNVLMPSSLFTDDPNLVGATVVVTTPAGSSQPDVVALAGAAPGLFTADGSGCGQAAALNVRADGTVSINSAANSAAPGDYVALFGTGIGNASVPSVLLDNGLLPTLNYSGPAPGLSGVEQVNFQIPASTRNGCSVPVSASQTWGSPSVTIAVQNGRGKCVDPPTQSYGIIQFLKFLAPGTSSEFFSASFPSGPNVVAPAPETVVYAPNQATGASVGSARFISGFVDFNPRTCAVPGYTDLSSGTIQIQPAPGFPVAVPPLPLVSGVIYSSVLPAGFIQPGRYTISGTPGGAVTLNLTATVGAPIQITSSFPAGSGISASQPVTVQWTGGDSLSLVRVALISGTGAYNYSYAPASAGSMTLSSQGLPLGANGQISVTVVPASPQVVSLPGITGPVRLLWQYGYNFPLIGFNP